MEARTHKGRSLLRTLENYVVIDLETTGLDPTFDSIIEVGAIKVKNGTIEDTYSSLINPGFEISDFIIALTGIKNEMLEAAPCAEAVIPSFLDFIGDAMIVGHNVNFDINFLYDDCWLLQGKYFTNDFVDTLRICRRLFPNLSNHKLSTVVAELKISAEPAHRALADCEATRACYEYMKNYAFQNGISFESSSFLYSSQLKASEVAATVDEFDTNHPFYGKYCAFTGALSFTRKEAMQMVANVGGINTDGVSKQTNFLVMGNNDYCKSIKNGKSSKQIKAENLILEGKDLTILSESAFLDILRNS